MVAYTAIDPEGATITWSIDADSSDDEDFSFDDGELTFNSPPNFEDAKGGGLNGTSNTYSVDLRASDGDSNNDRTWRLTINVTNVDEPGTVSLTTEQPKEGILSDGQSDRSRRHPRGCYLAVGQMHVSNHQHLQQHKRRYDSSLHA